MGFSFNQLDSFCLRSLRAITDHYICLMYLENAIYHSIGNNHMKGGEQSARFWFCPTYLSVLIEIKYKSK